MVGGEEGSFGSCVNLPSVELDLGLGLEIFWAGKHELSDGLTTLGLNERFLGQLFGVGRGNGILLLFVQVRGDALVDRSPFLHLLRH